MLLLLGRTIKEEESPQECCGVASQHAPCAPSVPTNRTPWLEPCQGFPEFRTKRMGDSGERGHLLMGGAKKKPRNKNKQVPTTCRDLSHSNYGFIVEVDKYVLSTLCLR